MPRTSVSRGEGHSAFQKHSVDEQMNRLMNEWTKLERLL